MLCHTTYHVLFLRHLDVKSLLLHLHRVVLDDLLVRVEEGLQNFGLDVGQAAAFWRWLAVVVSLLDLFELVVHVLFQLISFSNKILHIVPDGLDLLQKNRLVARHARQLFLKHHDLLKTFLMLGRVLVLLYISMRIYI